MNRRPTPETDNNEYAHLFIEQNGYESPLQESPEEWADFARRLERERDAERALADRLAGILQRIANEDYRGNRPHHCAVADCGVKEWKEVRSE